MLGPELTRLPTPGGSPRTLKVFDEADSIVRERVDLYRSVCALSSLLCFLCVISHAFEVEDFFSVDAAVRKGKRIAVIGGGFLGRSVSACFPCNLNLENAHPREP